MNSRLVSPLLAITVGVGSGIFIFKPLIESYEQSTKGSFQPNDDDHSAPVPALPLTGGLMPGKTLDGKDLPREAPTEGIVILEDQSGKGA